jgi:hypothetical protein
MPADDFVKMVSNPAVLGDPLLKTQHLIGGTRWERVNDVEAIGYHQLRVPHVRYSDETHQHVIIKGHAYSLNTNFYKRIDGEWKFAGMCPDIRWFEYDLDKVFAGGRDVFGEEKAAAEARAVNSVPEAEAINGVSETKASNGVHETKATNGVPEIKTANEVPDVEAVNGVSDTKAVNGATDTLAIMDVVGKPIIHVVLFEFKSSASVELVKDV